MALLTPVQISPSGFHNVATEAERRVLPGNWANEPFTFYHYPLAWQWSAKFGFYPDLSIARFRVGCNGVDQVKDPVSGAILKGRVNANALHAGCRAKGGIEVDPGDPRLKEWRNFVAKFPCDGGGVRYSFGVGQGKAYRGENFRRLANNQIKHTEAGEVFLEFCAFLRDNDLTHPLDPAAVDTLIENKTRARDMIAKLGKGSPHSAGLADRLTAEIDAMNADWEKLKDKYAAAMADDDGEQMLMVQDDAPEKGPPSPNVQIRSAP